jgi:hypothetical protein
LPIPPSLQDRASGAGNLRFMSEIWHEIAAYLPRRDLRALLQVPHSLGAIAGALLLRSISLHFGAPGDDALDAWHARRSAEILAHLAAHPPAAAAVRSLNVFAAGGGADAHAFQLGASGSAVHIRG